MPYTPYLPYPYYTTVQYSTVMYNTVLYSIVQYSTTVKYISAVLPCIVQYSNLL